MQADSSNVTLMCDVVIVVHINTRTAVGPEGAFSVLVIHSLLRLHAVGSVHFKPHSSSLH